MISPYEFLHGILKPNTLYYTHEKGSKIYLYDRIGFYEKFFHDYHITLILNDKQFNLDVFYFEKYEYPNEEEAVELITTLITKTFMTEEEINTFKLDICPSIFDIYKIDIDQKIEEFKEFIGIDKYEQLVTWCFKEKALLEL